MALVTNDIIKFNDLVANLAQSIVNMITNKGGTDSVPAQLRYNYGGRSQDIATDVHRSSYSGTGDKAYYTCNLSSGGMYWFDNATTAKNVIVQNLSSFFSSRGINNVFDPNNNSKVNTTVTVKGLLNLYNNFAAYVSQMILSVSSQELAQSYIMFNLKAINVAQDNVNYPAVNVLDDGTDYTTQNVNDLITNLNTILVNYTRPHIVKYTYKFYKCDGSSVVVS